MTCTKIQPSDATLQQEPPLRSPPGPPRQQQHLHESITLSDALTMSFRMGVDSQQPFAVLSESNGRRIDQDPSALPSVGTRGTVLASNRHQETRSDTAAMCPIFFGNNRRQSATRAGTNRNKLLLLRHVMRLSLRTILDNALAQVEDQQGGDSMMENASQIEDSSVARLTAVAERQHLVANPVIARTGNYTRADVSRHTDAAGAHRNENGEEEPSRQQ